MFEYFTIINTSEVLRFSVGSIVYVSAAGDYSHIHTMDGNDHTVTLQMGAIEKMMEQQLQNAEEGELIRVGKSLIVNMRYVFKVNPTRKQIVLTDNHTFKFNLEASKDALTLLKAAIEEDFKTN
ncbi:MAG: LytTR family transcriptional regulator [Bacteroidales bacterium]|nr:LytTR family transcriptional regulator [Bacteroidales bacterium]